MDNEKTFNVKLKRRLRCIRILYHNHRDHRDLRLYRKYLMLEPLNFTDDELEKITKELKTEIHYDIGRITDIIEDVSGLSFECDEIEFRLNVYFSVRGIC